MKVKILCMPYIDAEDGQKTVSYAVDFENRMLVPA